MADTTSLTLTFDVDPATLTEEHITISGSPQTAVVYRKHYSIGETGPAGGLIFHDKGSYSDGWRYLESWTADESGPYQWKTTNTDTGWTSDAIGTGYINTYTYMSSAAHPAAEVARNASHGGFEDWFLPSKDELNQMYLNLHLNGLGGFSTQAFCWSSSERDSIFCWYQIFWTGVQGASSRSAQHLVRAVRAF